jgi:hypothetical protein
VSTDEIEAMIDELARPDHVRAPRLIRAALLELLDKVREDEAREAARRIAQWILSDEARELTYGSGSILVTRTRLAKALQERK